MYIVKKMIGGSSGKLFPVNKNGNCIDGIEEEIIKFKTIKEAEEFAEELDTIRFVIMKWEDRNWRGKIVDKIKSKRNSDLEFMIVLGMFFIAMWSIGKM